MVPPAERIHPPPADRGVSYWQIKRSYAAPTWLSSDERVRRNSQAMLLGRTLASETNGAGEAGRLVSYQKARPGVQMRGTERDDSSHRTADMSCAAASPFVCRR
jgi:hypothetical protein